MKPQRVVSRDAWLEARMALLAEEKALTRARDRLAAARRALPWVAVEKDYRFDTPEGRARLADLFQGRDRLIVNHFMFHPDWEAGCVGCSFAADQMEGALAHVNAAGVTLAKVSRAPLAKLLAYQARMGWRTPWVSSHGSDFNRDFGVSFTPEELAAGPVAYNYGETGEGFDELPGYSVFARDEEGRVYHCYSSYARGNEEVLTAFMYLDMTPLGRNEAGTMSWVRRHDEYAEPSRAGAAP